MTSYQCLTVLLGNCCEATVVLCHNGYILVCLFFADHCCASRFWCQNAIRTTATNGPVLQDRHSSYHVLAQSTIMGRQHRYQSTGSGGGSGAKGGNATITGLAIGAAVVAGGFLLMVRTKCIYL